MKEREKRRTFRIKQGLSARQDGEKILDALQSELRSRLGRAGDISSTEPETLADTLIADLRREKNLSRWEREELRRRLIGNIRGLDILEELLDDPGISEIMVNGPDSIFIERSGHLEKWRKTFVSKERLEDAIQKIVGSCNRVINERSPIADARLPDGSRVNAVIAPAALDGPVLTIRRFPEKAVTMQDLIAFGSLTEEAASFLRDLVRASCSLMISGGTSAGKTTFLNALSLFIPEEERVITIEDNAELQLQDLPNLVRMEAKSANMEGNREISIGDLIKTSLRMRPDRLIIGEVRGAEAAELLIALNTGHEGSLSTIHANSAEDTISRLLTLALMGMPLPERALLGQIASGIDLVVYLSRMPDKSRRVTEISELDGMREGRILMNPIFRFDGTAGSLKRVGTLHHREKLLRHGIREDI